MQHLGQHGPRGMMMQGPPQGMRPQGPQGHRMPPPGMNQMPHHGNQGPRMPGPPHMQGQPGGPPQGHQFPPQVPNQQQWNGPQVPQNGGFMRDFSGLCLILLLLIGKNLRLLILKAKYFSCSIELINQHFKAVDSFQLIVLIYYLLVRVVLFY